MSWGKRAWQVVRHFDSDKNWSMEVTKEEGKNFYKIKGYNYNAGFYGTGFTIEEAWQSIIRDCQSKINWVEDIKRVAAEELHSLTGHTNVNS